MIRLAVLALACAVLVAACGHRGPLVPPGGAAAMEATDDLEKGRS